MKQVIFFCGIPVEVSLTHITEKEVPYYIRKQLPDRTTSYLQKKQETKTNWYFLKEVSSTGIIRFYKGVFPITDNGNATTA